MAEAALALCCPVCLDMPRNPVTIPCGHSYCMSCITGCWDHEDQKGIYSCPQCRQIFCPRPALTKNTMLADLAEKLKNMMPEATLRYAEPNDVPCDVCTGRKYKAVKSCLVCVVSFCELHLKPHCVSAAYEGHKLVTASSAIKEMICSTHKKPLEVYCQTDKEFACLLCVLEEHRGHEVVSAATERQAKQKEIEEMQGNSKKRIKRRESELTEITTSVETIRKFLLHRLIVVGRLSGGLADRTTVGVHFERLNVSVQRSRPGEEVTGVLLLYPEHALNVIECSTEALLSVLQDLRHMEENLHSGAAEADSSSLTRSGLILEPRILLVSHDLHSRLFQQWSYKLLSESDGCRTVVSEDQSSEELVRETLRQVLQLGRHLFNAAEQMTGSKVIPDEVLRAAADVIPPQAAVCGLVQMEALLSPARYLSTYHSPLHQLLDSGNSSSLSA
ncbi:Tripartite motif-containing protein 47 [Anabarilius grahami]|uniref:Tripartite motif-containing protein 47 n=1 Tax=Anabarilius grahami TaxID=495550 RepID=A0A3N0XP65_ANAGA|nr:Tripartite motif-containing protein 47 [Anabarilius grahami]